MMLGDAVNIAIPPTFFLSILVLATEHIRSKNRKETVKQETFMPPISYFDGKEKEPIQLS
jgi:hypothetical protein